MMIMIAFITIKSSLVPLIEGLCAQIQELRFEIIGGLRSHLWLFFFGKKNMLKKKSGQSKISSRLLTYIYTRVLCTRIRIYVFRDLVHLDSDTTISLIQRINLNSEDLSFTKYHLNGFRNRKYNYILFKELTDSDFSCFYYWKQQFRTLD